MFCPNCGKPVAGTCCPECGTSLGTSIFLRPYIPATVQEGRRLFRLVLEFALLVPVLAILMFLAVAALFLGLLFLLVRHLFL